MAFYRTCSQVPGEEVHLPAGRWSQTDPT